jgi:alpha-N-arabinofuranosidase
MMNKRPWICGVILIGFILLLAACAQDAFQAEPESGRARKTIVTVDANKKMAPISKYIYGQFIEHLGRCINGGVWAEMLQDRKFFFPITDQFNGWSATAGDGPLGSDEFLILVGSPWEVAGESGIVSMITGEDSYVGEHTPEIVLSGESPGGISQGRLGVVKGKKYTGYAIVAGDSKAAPVRVRLIWGQGEDDCGTVMVEKLSREYTKVPFAFSAGATTDDARLEITGLGAGKFRIGTASLMPADNIRGMRADTLDLMRQLAAPMYRWPGGCFVGGYDWRKALGQRDKRPPIKNPAWSGIDDNDFGMHEFIDFCRELDTEPFLAVDSGIGSVQLAADEVQYANGPTDTPMGKWRAQNGHPQPFNVKWWAVGNEMFGPWQNGYMPIDKYVVRHNETAEAMLAVDPSIELIAVGDVSHGTLEGTTWSREMYLYCADRMDYISEHFYVSDERGVLKTIPHIGDLAKNLKRVADAHRDMRKTIETLKDKSIPIALDEWNYSRTPHYYGEMGSRFYHKDGLGVGAGLHEFFRNSDIFQVANFAQTVNVLGAITTDRNGATFSAVGLPLKLYRRHFGTIPVEVRGMPRPLDIAAAWTADEQALTFAIVNPTERAYEIQLNLLGAKLDGSGHKWQIAHSDPMAFNEPGEEPQVKIERHSAGNISNALSSEPLSITLYSLSVQ